MRKKNLFIITITIIIIIIILLLLSVFMKRMRRRGCHFLLCILFVVTNSNVPFYLFYKF